jgi:transposase
MEMQRRKFSREFKLEAVKLVRERGVSVSQVARDLDLHENVLRKWVREQTADPGSAFPGHGVLKPEQQEIERLRRELARMKAERDILKKRRPTSPGTRYEVRVHREAPRDLAGVVDLRSARCFAQRLSRLASSGAQQARP